MQLWPEVGKVPMEPRENDLHYCQWTTASGGLQFTSSGGRTEFVWNAISAWAGRPYVSMGARPIKVTTSSFRRNSVSFPGFYRVPSMKQGRLRPDALGS